MKSRREEIKSVARFFYDITFHPHLKGFERIGAILMTCIFSLTLTISLAKLLGVGFIFGV